MERIVTMSPAFDKRDPNPSKDYGVHGVDIRMVLKGELGAMQFLLYTNWHLPHVADEFKAKGYHSEVLPADVGYHSPKPMYDGQETVGDECEYLDGKPCYYDGSGLYAETAYKVLLEGGSDALWKFLEAEYIERFGELK